MDRAKNGQTESRQGPNPKDRRDLQVRKSLQPLRWHSPNLVERSNTLNVHLTRWKVMMQGEGGTRRISRRERGGY